jgi:hypothetical protein
MGVKVKSSRMCFYGGSRHRPGVVFELPEGVKPSADMTVVDAAAPGVTSGAAPQRRSRHTGPQTMGDITRQDSQSMGPDALA